jgi:hypothetical protein
MQVDILEVDCISIKLCIEKSHFSESITFSTYACFAALGRFIFSAPFKCNLLRDGKNFGRAIDVSLCECFQCVSHFNVYLQSVSDVRAFATVEKQ